MPTAVSWLGIGLVAVVFYLVRRLLNTGPPAPLPPGPKGLPVLGNILDMPKTHEWVTFTKWGQQYGDISSITILGQTLVILNSVNMAIDMLDKKSSNYSDRPILQMGGELCGWRNTLVLVPYGDRFRSYRKNFHRTIGTHSSMRKYLPIEELETRRFLRKVLAKPEELSQHVRHTAGAIILRISHGYEVRERNDPFVNTADEAVEQFSLSTAPGAWLVDVMPILKYVPSWFPGAGFKRTAAHWRSTLDSTITGPHEFVKEQMTAGIAPPSYTRDLLEGRQLNEVEEHEIKWSAGSMYTGGADTTVSAIYAFFLAMVLHPEVQEKAKAELDAVIGQDRLPSFDDRVHLPYIEAVAKEAVRWHCVTPTGVPHRVAQDDIHKGYFIPKGALVITNMWQILHDPRVYPDPMKFNPDRFMVTNDNKPQRDPYDVCFGFGRRICPGRVLADASLFITCAMSLAVFDIRKAVENGVLIEPVHEQSTGTISHQLPFKCSIKPKSANAVALIHSED